ncbi:MAG: glycosyltransferase family 4 protein [Gemmatimonadaceae bacterium]
MQVFVVTNDFPPRVGGINYLVDQVMRRFPGGTVTIFASTYPGAAEFDATYPHPVIRLATTMLLPTPAVRRRLHNELRARRPDLVLFGAVWPLGHMGPGIRRKLGIPYAGLSQGLELTAARIPGLVASIGRNAVLVTAGSDWTRRRIERAFGHAANGSGARAMPILTSGIDAERFTPAVSDAAVRVRHSLGSAPVICCVSRLVPRKGQDMLIRALPRVALRVPDVRLLIVGSGPHEGALRRLAHRSAMGERIVFAGAVPYAELPGYFRAGDVFAMPCRARWFGLDVEALGAVFLQAAAVGRPVIAGRSGGAPEAVRHGATGLVVDPTSPDAIADALIALLGDPQRAAAMGAAGARWMHEEWTWDAIAARLQAQLAEALRQALAPDAMR